MTSPAVRVVEVHATLQGEGSLVGAPVVLVRLAGCNLWSGDASDRGRGRGVCAAWCDTEFRSSEVVRVEDLVDRCWRLADGWRLPVALLTGGEPALQVHHGDAGELVRALRQAGWLVAVETNGTLAWPADLEVDHLTVSPKALRDGGASLDHVVQRHGNDLKVVVPTPLDLEAMAGWDFCHRYLQPLDVGDRGQDSVELARRLAQRHGWRVSVQVHKWLGLP